LWSRFDRELGQIAATADDASGGRAALRPESERDLKRGHRRGPPVMAKDEFVEIDGQVMPADAVIRADEPLQIADGAVASGTTEGTPPCRALLGGGCGPRS